MPTKPDLEMFAVTAPGIEHLTAGELRGLGVDPLETERGGLAFRGGPGTLYETNLWLRTASRILVRLASFHASSFAELERRAKKIPWTDFLPPNGEASFRVTCRKSRLYHSDAVAERLMRSVSVARSDVKLSVALNDDDSEVEGSAASSQLFIVRLLHDEVMISADSSGALLHKRGYRQELTRAPLRETLAAAMVLASGWKAGTPLLDPLCGSGTIPIEAAMMARNIAPGISRAFAFQNWPSFDGAIWSEVLGHARAKERRSETGSIFGSDRDAGAVDISRRNAGRAEVGDIIEFERRPLAASLAEFKKLTGGSGVIVTNPPYGIRAKGGVNLRNLYGMLGARAERERVLLGVLAADEKLARSSLQGMTAGFRTHNGGLPVTFFTSAPNDE